jgi:hypothetical protein
LLNVCIQFANKLELLKTKIPHHLKIPREYNYMADKNRFSPQTLRKEEWGGRYNTPIYPTPLPSAMVRLEGLNALGKKKINDLIGTRTRHLPACSTVPQPSMEQLKT